MNFINRRVEFTEGIDGFEDVVAVLGYSKFRDGVLGGTAAVIINLRVIAAIIDASP